MSLSLPLFHQNVEELQEEIEFPASGRFLRNRPLVRNSPFSPLLSLSMRQCVRRGRRKKDRFSVSESSYYELAAKLSFLLAAYNS